MQATLSELEMTKLENFALKHTNLQQAIQANLGARAKYIADIEAAHPGCRFNEQTGQLVELTPEAAAVEA
jgi:hypothetical protein